MKRLFFAIGLFAAVACSDLRAQTMELRAKVPFDFRMGEKLMPAGLYLIHHSAGLLTVREQGGSNTAAMFLTLPEYRPHTPTTGTLEFNRYGENYFLAKIWAPGSRDGRSLTKSSTEKEIASRVGEVYSASIPLQHK
jgi:hypothetical protein